MPVTVQQVLDLARAPLNDASKTRYPDDRLLRYFNFLIRKLRTERADLFVGSLAGGWTDFVAGADMPVDETIHQAVADYITARALSPDDELTVQGKGGSFYTLFGGQTFGGT